MKPENKKLTENISEELENAEWGETHQERITDGGARNNAKRHRSPRHICKGRNCDTAFEKL